jgi:hypothetical protein
MESTRSESIAAKLARFEATIATNDESTSRSFIANFGKKERGQMRRRSLASYSLSVPVQVESVEAVEMSEFTETERGEDILEYENKERSGNQRRLVPDHFEPRARRHSMTMTGRKQNLTGRRHSLTGSLYTFDASTDDSYDTSAFSRQNTVKSIARQFETKHEKEELTHDLVQPGRHTSAVLQPTIEAFESAQPIKHTDDYEKYKDELAQTCSGLLDQNRQVFLLQSEEAREMNSRSYARKSSRRKTDSSSVRPLVLDERTDEESLSSSEEDNDNSFSSHSSDDQSHTELSNGVDGQSRNRVHSLRPGMERGHSIENLTEEMHLMHNHEPEHQDGDYERPRRRVNALRPGMERGHSVENLSEETKLVESVATREGSPAIPGGKEERPRRHVNPLRPGMERGHSVENLSEEMQSMNNSKTRENHYEEEYPKEKSHHEDVSTHFVRVLRGGTVLRICRKKCTRCKYLQRKKISKIRMGWSNKPVHVSTLSDREWKGDTVLKTYRKKCSCCIALQTEKALIIKRQ